MAILVQHNNPIAPATAPSADEILNAYQLHAQSIRGETQAAPDQAGYNPFKVNEDNQGDAQKAHQAQIEQYLSPVAMNHYDTQEQTSGAKEREQRFMQNMENDPAYKELNEPVHDVLNNLLAGIQTGKISHQDAFNMLADFGEQVIDPALEKHHGAHSASHKTSLHDLPVAEDPAIVKKAKGGR